jgi:hypothetical protein
MVELVNALLLSAINLSCEAQTVGVSMQPLLYIALQVTKQYEECDLDVCLTGVVYMLLTSSPADQLQLLQLCKHADTYVM